MLYLKKIKDVSFRWLSCCLYCSQFNSQDKVLCEYCWNVISPYVGENQWIIHKIKFLSLINWQAQKSDIVSTLALNLKENNNRNQWRFLAWQLLKMNSQLKITKNTVIIPAPAKVNQAEDHAFLLALAICEITYLPMKNILTRTNSTAEQKTKSQSERKKMTLYSLEKNSKLIDVVFVDDIVTTGSTAIAAYEALGKPQCYQVLSLIRRTL